MSKAKKRIAILCVVINIILLTQVCFGSVSAFYDALINIEAEDQHICDDCDEVDQAELQAESVCTQEQLENSKCHVCNYTINKYEYRYCDKCNQTVVFSWLACTCGATTTKVHNCKG